MSQNLKQSSLAEDISTATIPNDHVQQYTKDWAAKELLSLASTAFQELYNKHIHSLCSLKDCPLWFWAY